MASSLSALQFESAFNPKKLCNWEVPAFRAVTPGTRPPGFRTQTIVDDNGHLLSGVPKRMTSFTPAASASSSKRWPVAATAHFGGTATMGYKGIQTDYLPTSTIHLRNNPDSYEFNVRARSESHAPHLPLRFPPC